MEFKKITNKNLWDVANLQVKVNQKPYIATNTVSLLEAYATQNENERVETFAVYEKDILVGFIMINFNVFNWDGAPRVARNNYCIWRFMIDQRYQGKGLGKKALNKLIDYIRAKPLGEGKKYICPMYLETNGQKNYTKKLGLFRMEKKMGKKLC